MERQSRIISMRKETLAPIRGFVRVYLEDGHSFHTSEADLQCRDMRVGDTICYVPDTHCPHVLLELRPPGAVPFRA